MRRTSRDIVAHCERLIAEAVEKAGPSDFISSCEEYLEVNGFLTETHKRALRNIESQVLERPDNGDDKKEWTQLKSLWGGSDAND